MRVISFINSVVNFDYVRADFSSDTSSFEGLIFSLRNFLEVSENASLVPRQKLTLASDRMGFITCDCWTADDAYTRQIHNVFIE